MTNISNGHLSVYSMTIPDMVAEVSGLSTIKGWRTGETTFGEYIALLHSEASEALEAYRDHRLDSHTTPEGKPDDVGSELADVLIRVLDMCDVFNIDLAAEYGRKMAYGWTRPYQHGGRTLSDPRPEDNRTQICSLCGHDSVRGSQCDNCNYPLPGMGNLR